MTGPLFYCLAGYLAGSVPASYLAARLISSRDVRREGSGNVGATNVFRVAGRRAGIAAVAGDVLKSLLPVLAARLGGLAPAWVAAVGAAVIIGHCYSVFLGFSGGKGVLSLVSVFSVVSPAAALAFGIVWLVVYKAARFVSLASMLGALALPAALAALRAPRAHVVFAAAAALFVIYRHRGNVRRLLAGEEPRAGRRGEGAGR